MPKNELHRHLSHKLRTHLSISLESVSILRDGILGKMSAPQQELLVLIDDNMNRLTEVINYMMELWTLESGRAEFNKESARLPDFISQMSAYYRPKVEAKGLKFSTVEPENISFNADIQKIKRVLYILLDNALKCTETGFIEIKARSSENMIEFTVTDSGPACSKNLTDKSPAEAAESAARNGELELILARCLAQAQGGNLSAENLPDKCVRFTLSLPRN